jgi:hypothetical protein
MQPEINKKKKMKIKDIRRTYHIPYFIDHKQKWS